MSDGFLESIELELERHEMYVEGLRQLRDMRRRLVGSTEPTAPVGLKNEPQVSPSVTLVPSIAPPDSRPTRSGRREIVYDHPTPDEVRDYVVANGPLRRGEIHAALGGNLGRLGKRLRRLIEDGEIATIGNPPDRRYGPPTARRRQQASPLQEIVVCDSAEAMLKLIPEHGQVSAIDLHQRTGCAIGQLVSWGRELTARGSVTHEGDGRERRWRATGRELMQRVADLIVARPGTLSEREIADTLGVAFDAVVDACGRLLDRGAVRINDQNGYVPLADPRSLDAG
jgi:hypothetical protein